MRTPAGKECPYFFGDYFRGRNREECRLLENARPPLAWRPALCETCPVPQIMAANACEHMQLTPRLARPFPFVRQIVQVRAACRKSHEQGFDPHVGCGSCHSLPTVFMNIDHDPDASS